MSELSILGTNLSKQACIAAFKVGRCLQEVTAADYFLRP
jgi:hypothetical protein